MKVKNLLRYESFIFIGIIMIIAVFLKIRGIYNFSSDWFWLIAGMALIIEGSISLIKQKMFDKKYKVILRE